MFVQRDRKNTKLKDRNYSAEGLYHVTICTEHRLLLLGFKEGDEIQLTSIGQQVRQSWAKIATMYESITLDAYMVMPNHLHGIVVYHRPTANTPPLHKVIRDFKSYTTHVYYQDPFRLTGNLWGRGYYERIVRYDELDSLREYILKNPVDWENDEFFELERKYQQSL